MAQGDVTTMEARIPRRDVDTACAVCGAVVGQPCDFAKVGGEIRHVLAEMGNAMDRAKQHPPLGGGFDSGGGGFDGGGGGGDF